MSRFDDLIVIHCPSANPRNLGMQIAVIEYARNVCSIPKAASIELDERTSDPVIIFMPEIDRATMGATMRLGLRQTCFQPNSEWSKLRALYGETAATSKAGKAARDNSNTTNGTTANGAIATQSDPTAPLAISERHRHRYEVNPAYIEKLSSHGLSFIGKDVLGERMEILELKDHPWYVGTQYHPEYLSRVLRPSKPYLGFVAASAGCLKEILAKNAGGNGLASGELGVDLVNGMEGVSI